MERREEKLDLKSVYKLREEKLGLKFQGSRILTWI